MIQKLLPGFKTIFLLFLFAVFTSGPQAAAATLEVVAGEPISATSGTLEDLENPSNPALPQTEILQGIITKIITNTSEALPQNQVNLAQQVFIKITTGSLKDNTIAVDYNRVLASGERPFQVGDRVLINRSVDNLNQDIFYITDVVRTPSLIFVFLAFTAIVILVGQRQGIQSLLGLALSFVIMFSLLIPGIQSGLDPLLVTIGSAILIMITTFYLSHGINQKTTWAVLGTFISLLFTGILAKIFIYSTRLTGFSSEEAVFLQFIKQGSLNIQGILLAGIIIGTLGVLDDITISQASIVNELKEANPKIKFHELFFRAMRVGRDHISSLTNTLVLAYAGSSLPLLLLFTFDQSGSLTTILSYEIVAEEIVRTLVGSIGLIAAVPITTFLAAKYGFKTTKH